MTFFNFNSILIYPARKVKIALLIAKELKILTNYLNFLDIFLEEKALMLLKITELNQYVIKLQKSQQPPYRLIYSLVLLELETLKIFIKTNFANGFIWSLKSPVGIPILFIRKLNGNCHLCVNYQGFNNLTIKNWYPLLLISKSLNRLRQTKRFI